MCINQTLRPASSQRGFALVIALSLMAFVLLLLLTLTTFVRTEIKVTQISQEVLKARQNALLGLLVAVGDLQKYAGSDQRATAQSNILFTAEVPSKPTNPSAAERVDRMSVTGDYWNGKNPYWTGVWDTEIAAG
jgi:type II secretory pathway component PulK